MRAALQLETALPQTEESFWQAAIWDTQEGSAFCMVLYVASGITG